ncbi:MAG: hypothetical protein R3A12_15155 [Ignavibacteria bacterium]
MNQDKMIDLIDISRKYNFAPSPATCDNGLISCGVRFKLHPL